MHCRCLTNSTGEFPFKEEVTNLDHRQNNLDCAHPLCPIPQARTQKKVLELIHIVFKRWRDYNISSSSKNEKKQLRDTKLNRVVG